MSSQPFPALPARFRFGFDRANKILLIRCKGTVTDELLEESYQTAQKHAAEMDARVTIMDCSFVTRFDISTQLIRQLADRKPVLTDAKLRRFIVAPEKSVFGLARMFQMMGESTRPLLEVVHTLDEAFAKLSIQSPHFEPLE